MSEIIKYIILGIVQGFTEPLPISSSGHLAIFQQLLDMQDLSIAFAAFVNFGSTLAIIFFFRDEVKELITTFYYLCMYMIKDSYKQQVYKHKASSQLILKIIIATLPLVLVGVSMKVIQYTFNLQDTEPSVNFIGFALIITGILLLLVYKKEGVKTIDKLTYKDALIIGIAQAIAVIPGISRSGITMVCALYIGMEKKDAFNFSFLMFIPASIGALIFGMLDLLSATTNEIMLYLVSFILAGVFTWVGLLLTKKVIVAQKLIYFSIYCFIVGSLTMFLL